MYLKRRNSWTSRFKHTHTHTHTHTLMYSAYHSLYVLPRHYVASQNSVVALLLSLPTYRKALQLCVPALRLKATVTLERSR
jgi:hypothetical protein